MIIRMRTLVALTVLIGVLGLACPSDSTAQGTPTAQEVQSLRARAEQGDALAQFSLGVLYDMGQVVPQDHVEACKWFRKAADQGHSSAQFNLGVAYADGMGVPQDYVEAHKWHNLAASQASVFQYRRRAEARDAVAKLMSPAQIADAQRRAREWQEAFDRTTP